MKTFVLVAAVILMSLLPYLSLAAELGGELELKVDEDKELEATMEWIKSTLSTIPTITEFEDNNSEHINKTTMSNYLIANKQCMIHMRYDETKQYQYKSKRGSYRNYKKVIVTSYKYDIDLSNIYSVESTYLARNNLYMLPLITYSDPIRSSEITRFESSNERDLKPNAMPASIIPTIYIKDRSMAESMKKAFVHAAKLCGSKIKEVNE